MLSGHKSKPQMPRNLANSTFNHSLKSQASKATAGRVEQDRAESLKSISNVDPRFMIIQKDEPPPSPKTSTQADVKVENWLHSNDNTHIDLTKIIATTPVLDKHKQNLTPKPSTVQTMARKPYFQNLKMHNSKSVTRARKPRSISASRATISNQEVSSTNEETPRHRKVSLQEKLNKLHTPVPTTNSQTIDIHHDECRANDLYDCCFKRKCESKINLEHNVTVMNLCCPNRKLMIMKPKIIPDPVLTEEEEENDVVEKLPKKIFDKVGEKLNRSRLYEEQISLIRMKKEIENFYRPHGPSDIKPIYKLLITIAISIFMSLALFSVYYDIGIFTRLYRSIEAWIESSALVAMQRSRPPTKWELWSKFIKKCVEKMSNVGRKF